jgi:catechol 2,3-dioxygenase-like lactoylglutathione lyase family enzyme
VDRHRPLVTGLAGVIVSTSPDRFPAMERFYTEVLGLSPRSRRDGFVNFELGGQRLTITLHSDVAGPSRDPARMLVNLACPDVDAAGELLRHRGVRLVRSPETEGWGGRILTVADPDGNLVQLMSLPPSPD